MQKQVRLLSAVPQGGSPDISAQNSPGEPEVTRRPSSEAVRAASYGEALLAISRYISEDLVSPPDQSILETLGRAFAGMESDRKAFSPEDFALYAMSLLHRDLGGSAAEVLRMRRGAMQYLVDRKHRLSPDFQQLSGEALAFLEATQEPPSAAGETVAEDRANPTANDTDPGAHPARANQRASADTAASLAPAAPQDIPYRRQRLHLSGGGAVATKAPTGTKRRSSNRRVSKTPHLVLGVLLIATLGLAALGTFAALLPFLPD